MKVTTLKTADPRSYAVVFADGDDPMEGLLRFAKERELTASSFTAIGAVSRAVLGFFDVDARDYHRIPVEEQAEVVSLTGNITCSDGEPQLHIHAVLGRRDGSAVAGHLLEARVRPTLEVMLTESPATLARRHDPATGLALLAGRDG